MQKKLQFYLKLIAIFISIAIIISIHPFLLRSYAGFFTVNNYSKGADAILILGGNGDTRVKKAIDLYNEDFSSKILLSTPHPLIREYDSIWVSGFENTKNLLTKMNSNFQVVENSNGGARSTYDEARDLAAYIDKNPMKRVIIVTDNFHTRRAFHAFKKVFKKKNIKTQIEIAGAENQVYDETNWWKTERGLDAYVSEGFKFIIYLISDDNLDGLESE